MFENYKNKILCIKQDTRVFTSKKNWRFKNYQKQLDKPSWLAEISIKLSYSLFSLKGPVLTSFLLLVLSFQISIQLNVNVNGFEPRTSGFESNRSTNWATTTALISCLLCRDLPFLQTLTWWLNSNCRTQMSQKSARSIVNHNYHRFRYDWARFKRIWILNFKTWVSLNSELANIQLNWNS